MIAFLTVIILVCTALFGAVFLSKKLNGKDKTVSSFECGCKPSDDPGPFRISLKPAILFLALDAIVIVILLITSHEILLK